MLLPAIKNINFSIVLLGRLYIGTKWVLTPSLKCKRTPDTSRNGLDCKIYSQEILYSVL